MGFEATALSMLARLGTPMYRQWLVRWGQPLKATCVPRYQAAWTVATPEVLTAPSLEHAPGPNPNAIHTWLVDEHSAFAYGRFELDILLESRGGLAILISGIAAEVESRSTEPLGAVIQSPPAGAIDRIFLGFDLSRPSPIEPVVVKRELGDEWTSTPYFSGQAISVAAEEAVPVKVLAKCGDETVSWRLRVSFRVRGHSRELLWPPLSEQPFRVTDMPAGASEQHFVCGLLGLDGPPYLRPVNADFGFHG